MNIMAMGVLFHCTEANSFELVVRQSYGHPQGRQNRGESRRDNPFPKTYELTLFTMIVHKLENSIRNTRPFCHPLICHRSLVK